MKSPKFVVYQSKDGYRWRLVAANGRIVAEGGEAYTRRKDCLRAMYRVPIIWLNADWRVTP